MWGAGPAARCPHVTRLERSAYNEWHDSPQKRKCPEPRGSRRESKTSSNYMRGTDEPLQHTMTNYMCARGRAGVRSGARPVRHAPGASKDSVGRCGFRIAPIGHGLDSDSDSDSDSNSTREVEPRAPAGARHSAFPLPFGRAGRRAPDSRADSRPDTLLPIAAPRYR
jgi:hypothetical protein